MQHPYKITNFSALFIFFLIFQRNLYAFPVSFTHLKLPFNTNYKSIILIGDVHNLKKEKRKRVKNSLKKMDRFFRQYHNSLNQRNKAALIWEYSSKNEFMKSKNSVYLNRKAYFFRNKNKDFNNFSFIESDTLRSSSTPLRKFLLKLINYKPNNKKIGNNLADEINHVFLSKQGNILEKKILIIKKKSEIDSQTLALLRNNIHLYRNEIKTISQSLALGNEALLSCPDTKRQRYLLAQVSTDLEILLNIFLCNENKIIVYAGNGHVKRVRDLLKKLAAQELFTISNKNGLTKKDFGTSFRSIKKTTRHL